MTPDDVRALSRAASQLAALAQPDVAAVLAALPRRPGSTASLAEIAEASGLEQRTLGKAVARGRDAGVFALATDGQVGLDAQGARAAVVGLVALTPLGAALAERDLTELAPYGLIDGVPSGERAGDLLAVAAGLLPEHELNEAEVTAALAALGTDPVGLRRALVDADLLWRTPDGARYRPRHRPDRG